MSIKDADPAVFDLGVPILGICYGCQEIAWRANSANVAAGEAREYGHAVGLDLVDCFAKISVLT